MALLGIISEFEATHGSRQKRRDKFTIEVVLKGPIEGGFVRGIDHAKPAEKLNEIVGSLEGRYLDDIVGRATNENIAQYFMFNLRDLPLHAIKVVEGRGAYVEVSAQEFDSERYPAQLSYNLGLSLLLRTSPERAKEHLTKAINSDERFAEAHNLRGRCFKYLNDYESALRDFLCAIEIRPDFGEAWRNVGNALLYLERFEEMEQAFNKCVELMPDSALAINNRGYGHYVRGKYELALEDHKRAIEIDPKYAEAHYDRAMALKALGNNRESEEALAESKRLKETQEDTYFGVGMY